jgi:F-type H+-transporting ATPase subunit alpha
MPVEEQVVSIFVGTRGYLDKLQVGDVQRFEQELLREVRAKHSEILETIRMEKQISSGTEGKLRQVVEDFSKAFA